MLVGPAGSVRGGGTRSEAAGAPGCSREEKPAAEGARWQSKTLPEKGPQGCAGGRAGGSGAAGKTESSREERRASPQCGDAGGASARGFHKCSDAGKDAALILLIGQTSWLWSTETAGQSLN